MLFRSECSFDLTVSASAKPATAACRRTAPDLLKRTAVYGLRSAAALFLHRAYLHTARQVTTDSFAEHMSYPVRRLVTEVQAEYRP